MNPLGKMSSGALVIIFRAYKLYLLATRCYCDRLGALQKMVKNEILHFLGL